MAAKNKTDGFNFNSLYLIALAMLSADDLDTLKPLTLITQSPSMRPAL